MKIGSVMQSLWRHSWFILLFCKGKEFCGKWQSNYYHFFHLESSVLCDCFSTRSVADEHIDKVNHRIAVCLLQRDDLTAALDLLLKDIYAGRKRHRTCNNLHYRQPRWSTQPMQTLAMVVIAMTAAKATGIKECGPFDTDSALVGVDNRCSGGGEF